MPPSRGISHEATRPTTRPVAKPTVTSWSTNLHQTKCPLRALSAAASASTAGRASPSLSPDSRFSEWRTSRGTRGSVTTLDDSTGSVGASSAPSRKHSVQVRSVSSRAHERDDPRGQWHRQHQLAQRQMPVVHQHLLLDLEAVTEQDHDQRHGRQVADEGGAGAGSEVPR